MSMTWSRTRQTIRRSMPLVADFLYMYACAYVSDTRSRFPVHAYMCTCIHGQIGRQNLLVISWCIVQHKPVVLACFKYCMNTWYTMYTHTCASPEGAHSTMRTPPPRAPMVDHGINDSNGVPSPVTASQITTSSLL